MFTKTIFQFKAKPRPMCLGYASNQKMVLVNIGQYSIVHLMSSLELYLKKLGHPNADAKGKDMGKRNFPICTAFS